MAFGGDGGLPLPGICGAEGGGGFQGDCVGSHNSVIGRRAEV